MESTGRMDRDGEALLGFLVPAAEKLLADPRKTEVEPLAVLLGPGDEVLPLEPASKDGPAPDPAIAFQALCNAIRRHAVTEPECRAAGVFVDVHLVREDIDLHTDAIRFFLETRGGEAVNVFLPYRLSEKGDVETEETFAVEAEPFLFKEETGAVPGGDREVP